MMAAVQAPILKVLWCRFTGLALLFMLCALSWTAIMLPALSAESSSEPVFKAPGRRTIQIYFATTRLNTGSEKSPEYSGERHLDKGGGNVEYGIAGLIEPDDLQSPSTAENGKRYKKLLRQDADDWRKTEFTFVSKTDGDAFYKRLREWTGTICIYVHGYDKPFIQAVQDASMLFSDYQQYENSPQKKLLPLLFSWPSVGGRTEYGTDEANLEWSGPAFDNFLERILQEKNPQAQVDVVAHSMGVRLIMGYLSKQCVLADRPLFRNLFLCSGDIDFHLVEMKKEVLDRAVSNRIYIFVSDRDKAMILSHFIHEQPRLGRPVDPPKFTLAQRSQLFSSVYLEKLAIDTSDLIGGNAIAEPADVRRWLSESPKLDQEFSKKARFVDVTDLVTKDFGHGAAFSVIASYMAGKDIPQLQTQVVHKKPDRTTLRQSGGKPEHLYRFHRLEPFSPY